jgi:limonene 1,2-monooxygenase
VAQEIAAEHGRTMNPDDLRLVVPWYIAETRQKAREDVQFAFTRWLDYQRAQDATRYNVPAGKDPVDWYVESNLGVIGTPDDVIAVIEKLEAKQGPFGCFCQYAADWADWDGTKRSYELFARYVVPHFNRSNVNRKASLEWLRQHNVANAAKQKAAAEAMFQQHAAERGGRRGPAGS